MSKMLGIIVSAIKGGTGKSLISANLAMLLSKSFRVALVDCDVDSPNLPGMVGLTEPIKLTGERIFVPAVLNENLKVISTGLFQRGIFTICKTGRDNNQIVKDMIKNTEWKDIDIMVCDSPAGSSDELRAIMDSGIGIIGVVIVSQPTTYDDCWRVIEICTRFKIPIIGVIENMDGAVFEDGTPVVHPVTGRPFIPLGDPQGDRDIKTLAKRTKIEYLGSVPLVENMYDKIKSGNPKLLSSVIGPINRVVDIIRSAMGVVS